MPQHSTPPSVLDALDGVTEVLEALASEPSLHSSPCSGWMLSLRDAVEDLVVAGESFLADGEGNKGLVISALGQCKAALAHLRSGNTDRDYVIRVLLLAVEQMRAGLQFSCAPALSFERGARSS